MDYTNFFQTSKFNAGQQVLLQDYENISKGAGSNLLHALVMLLTDTSTTEPRSGVFRGMVPSMNSGDLAVTAGVGLSVATGPNTADFDYENVRFVVHAGNNDYVLPAEPGVFPRVDVAYIEANTTDDTNDSRTVVATAGPTYTPTNLDLRTNHDATAVTFVTGTEGSYAVPAIPDGAIKIAEVTRVSSGVVSLSDARPALTLSTYSQAYPDTAMTRAFVYSGLAVTAATGLYVQVAAGIGVGQYRRPVRVPRSLLLCGSDGSAFRWTYIVLTEAGLVANIATAGVSYVAPTDDECRLASVYVAAGGTTPGDIIDERNTQQWARGEAFARGERVPVANLPGVHWYVESANITSDGDDGYFIKGTLQNSDGTEYNPSTDGTLVIRGELWRRRDVATYNDGSSDYSGYSWEPDCHQGLSAQATTHGSYVVPGTALIPLTVTPPSGIYSQYALGWVVIAGAETAPESPLILGHAVRVPHGATITSVVVRYNRGSAAAGSIYAELNVHTSTTGAASIAASGTESGGSAGNLALTLTPAATVTTSNSYSLEVHLTNGAGALEAMSLVSVQVNYTENTLPGFAIAFGTDTSTILSAYQSGQAVWADSENHTGLTAHIRAALGGGLSSDYDRLRLVLTADRVATSVTDDSGLTAAEAAAQGQAQRTNIVNAPAYITTTTQVEVAL